MNKMDTILGQLRELGLKSDEARLYVELLREPSTHLKLAHATGINRTKVYRLASDMEKRSLISRRTDDRGTFLVAADPTTLEVALVAQEEKIKSQRSAFDALIPMLEPIKQKDQSSFIIQTYEGEEGFKQMLWHELKTEHENLIFGYGTIENLVSDRRWAEKHRNMTTQTSYKVREILNPDNKSPIFTLNQDFLDKHYSYRLIPETILKLRQQVAVYNNTVATYGWRMGQRVGVEIINEAYANTMRQMFEHYWQLAKDPPKNKYKQ